jgi:hypothetical protein
LSEVEMALFKPHFDAALLDRVRIFDDRVPFWLRRDMQGVTLGRRIYFRAGACDPRCADGIELLAHELAHVVQYARGMTIPGYVWASRRGYWRNPYEAEARAVGTRVRAALG